MRPLNLETQDPGEDSGNDLQMIEQLYAKTNESAMRKNQAEKATAREEVVRNQVTQEKSK